MIIIKFIYRMSVISIIYYATILFIYYCIVRLSLLPKENIDKMHNANNAPSISYFFLIFLPIILFPCLLISFKKFHNNKKELLMIFYLNIIFIVSMPIAILLFFKVPSLDPVVYNIIITQIISITTFSSLYYRYNKKIN
jgi:uncharacterized membrane protein YhaH (DUF805 family)